MTERIKVIDIELSRSFNDIDDLAGYSSVRGLVRLHRTPLGYVDIPVMDGKCRAQDVSHYLINAYYQDIFRNLLWSRLGAIPPPPHWNSGELWAASPPRPQAPLPWVTVAVCTRNRTQDLAACLEALVQVDYSNLELLIVDNAPSTAETQDFVRRRYPWVRYVVEPRPGLNWARNRAILAARGEIIAFTDDDVMVDAGWVQALALLFAENPDVMSVTGLVVPYELETEAQILFERNGGFTNSFERRWCRINREAGERVATFHGLIGQLGAGANMAYRKRVFDEIGLFDPALDVGTPTSGGGDLEMFFRVLKAGHTLVYEPRAVTRHRHRRETAQLRAQLMNDGTGFTACVTRCLKTYPEEFFAFLPALAWWAIHWMLGRALLSLLSPARFPLPLILAEAQGALTGPRRYAQARQEAERIAQAFGPFILPPQERLTASG
jgi:GT2 family glycosyltransferase